MPGSSRPREIACVADRHSIAAFLSEAAGRYALSKSDRRWGIVGRVFGICIAVPMLIAMALDGTFSPLTTYRVAIYVAGTVLLVFSVVEAIDFASASVYISPSGVRKTSRISHFALWVSAADITGIRLSEKGSAFYLSVHSVSRFARTFSLPADAKPTVLLAAHGSGAPLPVSAAAQAVVDTTSSCLIGVGIGFVGAMIALPLYTEASRLLAAAVAIIAVGSAAFASERMANNKSTGASRARRVTCAALAAFCCSAMLVAMVWSVGVGA